MALCKLVMCLVVGRAEKTYIITARARAHMDSQAVWVGIALYLPGAGQVVTGIVLRASTWSRQLGDERRQAIMKSYSDIYLHF